MSSMLPLMKIGFLALLATIPFSTSITASFPIYPVLALASLSLLGMLALWTDRKPPTLSIPMGALAVWILFQTFHASVWHHSTGILEMWFMAVLLGYLAWTLSTRDPSMARTTMILLWCAASLIAALNPSWQTSNDVLEEALRNAHMEESYKQAILHAAMQQRFLFPFGNPIHLGLFLSFSLLSFPALYSLTEKQERPLLWRTALIVTAIAQVYVLWGTRARTSLLAMAFAIGVMIVLWKGFNRRLLIGGLLGAFLVFFATLCTPAGREMLSRVETVRARAIYWEVALRMVRDHPFLGCGVGGFGDHYSRYRPLTPHQTEFPHQIFLETMTDWGAIGFLLFLFVLMRYGPRWWRGVRAKLKDQDTEGRLFVLWQVSVFAAFALAAQVGFPHNKVYLVGVAATILCLRPRGERDGQLASHVPKTQSIGWKPLWLLALIPLSILFCAREISQFQYEQGKSAFEKTGVSRGVYDLMLKSVRVWPPQWEAWYFAGRMNWDAGVRPRGLEQIEEAIRWNPTTAFLHEDRAKFLWEMGKRDEALGEIEIAIALHPVKWQYHQTYSAWLHSAGRDEDAVEQRKIAEQLKEIEPDYGAEVEKIRKTQEGS